VQAKSAPLDIAPYSAVCPPKIRPSFCDFRVPHSLGARGGEAGAKFPGHKHFSLLKDWISRAF